MIIEQLKLANIGRHEDLVIDSAVPIVGILGSNGSGKSTVLDALQFALTGETRDNLDTYVRNFTGNGSVYCRFRKNGRVGEIYRQIGKQSKRSLKWEGKEINSAKDINKAMSDIMGSDCRAVASAIFVNQGMLHKILFSKAEERKSFFVELVNMAYCERREKLLAGHLGRLQATMPDLSGLKDAAATERDQACAVFDAKKLEFEQLPDRSEYGIIVDHQLDTESRLVMIEKDRIRWNTEAATRAQVLNALLVGLEGENLEEKLCRLDAQIEDLKAGISDINEDLTKRRTGFVSLTNYVRISNQIQQLSLDHQALGDAKARLLDGELDLSTLTSSRDALADQISKNDARNEKIRNWRDIKVKLDEAKARCAEWARHVQELTDTGRSKQHLEDLKSQRIENGLELRQLKSFAQVQSELIKCGMTGESQCTKCGLTVSDPELLSPASQARLAEQIRALEFSQTNVDTKVTELHQIWVDADQNTAAWKKLKDEHEKTLAGIGVWLKENPSPFVDGQDIGETLRKKVKLDEAVALIPEKQRQIVAILKEINQARTTLKACESAKELLPRKEEYTQEAIHELSNKLSGLRARLAGLEKAEQSIGAKTSLVTDAQNEINRLAKLEKQYEEELNRPIHEELKAIWIRLALNWYAVKSELQGQQSVRHEKRGQMNEAEATFQRANNRYQDVLTRIAANEKKVELVGKLRRVQDLLSVDGLPMTIVRHHFRHLTKFVQIALTKMESTFQIDLDPDNDLNFVFRRLDQDSSVTMDMEKLSGGQRVRLCVAFLMAVQQRLVRDVGLLVLDEVPFLDQQGVESMVVLLKDMAAKLAASEMQIWVVDHNPILEQAFSKTIHLKV